MKVSAFLPRVPHVHFHNLFQEVSLKNLRNVQLQQKNLKINFYKCI